MRPHVSDRGMSHLLTLRSSSNTAARGGYARRPFPLIFFLGVSLPGCGGAGEGVAPVEDIRVHADRVLSLSWGVGALGRVWRL